MADPNTEYFWQMLRDEKIIEDSGDDRKKFRIHPSFQPILSDYMVKNQDSMMRALMYAAMSYCPTASKMQLSVICNFISNLMHEKTPELGRKLQKELDIMKIRDPRIKGIPLEDAIKFLKNEASQK